jgi:hypothetical protein
LVAFIGGVFVAAAAMRFRKNSYTTSLLPSSSPPLQALLSAWKRNKRWPIALTLVFPDFVRISHSRHVKVTEFRQSLRCCVPALSQRNDEKTGAYVGFA